MAMIGDRLFDIEKPKPVCKPTERDMQIAVSKWFGVRANTIVPNVSWGLLEYEADLIVMSKSGYLTEIEIKISKADLKNDFKKDHSHDSKLVKYFYYAIPEYMKDCIEMIPDGVGVLIVYIDREGTYRVYPAKDRPLRERHPYRKLYLEEQFQLARLGNLRYWSYLDRKRRKANA